MRRWRNSPPSWSNRPLRALRRQALTKRPHDELKNAGRARALLRYGELVGAKESDLFSLQVSPRLSANRAPGGTGSIPRSAHSEGPWVRSSNPGGRFEEEGCFEPLINLICARAEFRSMRIAQGADLKGFQDEPIRQGKSFCSSVTEFHAPGMREVMDLRTGARLEMVL